MNSAETAAEVGDPACSPRHVVGRVAGITFGAGAQFGFLLTVPFLFRFLRYGGEGLADRWLFRDALLALQFAVSHSLLLHPATKRRITRWLPSDLYGCLFAACTCVSLALVVGYWKRGAGVLWDLRGVSMILVLAGFYLSWISLFYSLWLNGLGYQTGLIPFLNWMAGRTSRPRALYEAGIYGVLRHPVYLSFLGLIWFTPRMTWDHVLLTTLWTIYIFVGSHLKDERIAFYVGESYRGYQARVPGFPFVPWGPLARRRVG